jgi:hypothetical protein
MSIEGFRDCLRDNREVKLVYEEKQYKSRTVRSVEYYKLKIGHFTRNLHTWIVTVKEDDSSPTLFFWVQCPSGTNQFRSIITKGFINTKELKAYLKEIGENEAADTVLQNDNIKEVDSDSY